MAKTVKSPSTPLSTVERLFGPVLPGSDAADRTISVFRDYLSAKKYALYGKLGILPGALWHLHTVLPIDPTEVKARITGIIEEGPQHNPNRREFVAKWREEFEAKQKLGKVKKIPIKRASVKTPNKGE